MSNPKGAGRKRTLTPLEEVDIYKSYIEGGSILDLIIKYRVSQSTILRTVKRISKQVSEKSDGI